MNDLIAQFKVSCHLAGATLKRPSAKLDREFGLGDFLENSLTQEDDARDIVVKAIRYFVDDEVMPTQPVFQFAVIAVCEFLNRQVAKRVGPFSTIAAQDLVKLLRGKPTDESIRGWAISHFA